MIEETPLMARAIRWLTVATFAVIGISATVGNELRSQDVDPQYARVIVDRTIRYGGTFYQNGIHNKGPLEPFVYLVASWFTTGDGFWYAISLFIALAALLLAGVAAATARFTGASRELALAVGAALFIHLTLSGADYAGVLYARNMIVCLLAAAWFLTFADRAWSSRQRSTASAVAIGIVLGLSVQTLLSTAATAGVLLLVAVAYRRKALVTVASAAATFFSAPLYYALRGSWTEFWSGWWVQARNMSVGTGRSLGSQFALGLHQLGEYYQHRPLAVLIVVAFLAIMAEGWRSGDLRFRLFHAGLGGWFVAAWIELILSQRYSSHYFVVSTVPTALMAAAVAGHAYRAVMRTRSRPLAGAVAWPLIAVVLAVFLSGSQSLTDAMRTVNNFTSPQATEVARERNTGGEERETWAVLDLVSHRGDPLLTWSNDAWPYLKYHRVAATRFIWKSFLMGEIYLGRTSTDYVLPHSWTWFAEDVARTRPVAFIETNPRDKGTPFDQLITQRFAPVFGTEHDTVYLRADVASEVFRDQATTPWAPAGNVPNRTWLVDGQHATLVTKDAEELPLTRAPCVRLEGQMTIGPAAGIRFQFTDTTGKTEPLHIAVGLNKVATGSDAVEYLTLPAGSTDGPVPFTLVVGRRAAALIIDGRIRGALRLAAPMSVGVVGGGATVELQDLKTGPVAARSGC